MALSSVPNRAYQGAQRPTVQLDAKQKKRVAQASPPKEKSKKKKTARGDEDDADDGDFDEDAFAWLRGERITKPSVGMRVVVEFTGVDGPDEWRLGRVISLSTPPGPGTFAECAVEFDHGREFDVKSYLLYRPRRRPFEPADRVASTDAIVGLRVVAQVTEQGWWCRGTVKQTGLSFNGHDYLISFHAQQARRDDTSSVSIADQWLPLHHLYFPLPPLQKAETRRAEDGHCYTRAQFDQYYMEDQPLCVKRSDSQTCSVEEADSIWEYAAIPEEQIPDGAASAPAPEVSRDRGAVSAARGAAHDSPLAVFALSLSLSLSPSPFISTLRSPNRATTRRR